MAADEDFDLEKWVLCKNIKFIHFLKLASLMLRMLLCLCVLMSSAMLLLFTPDELLARRVDWGGRMTAGSCFFLTSEEHGFEFNIMDIVSASAGTQTFCGGTPTDVAETFDRNMFFLNAMGWTEDCLPNLAGLPSGCGCHRVDSDGLCPEDGIVDFGFMSQFFASMCFAMFFVCASGGASLSDMRSKFSDLPGPISFLQKTWMYFFLTILPNYLISPMGSVVMLPEPADKVVLIRTPPDYVFIQLYSLCIVVPSTCCLLCYACCCVDQGSNGHRSCGAAYTCSLLCTAGLVTPMVLLVMLAYLDMGNLFFIDWNFKVSIDLSFVGMAMIAKCFLGAVAVLDSIVYIISLIQDACWLEEKKTQVERFNQKYEVENPQPQQIPA